MARLRDVFFYPYSGWPQFPWSEGRNAQPPYSTDILDRDAAARSSRAVTEALSRRLAAYQIETRRRGYGINILDQMRDSGVEATPLPKYAKDGFAGRVELTRGFRLLLPVQRAEVLTEVAYLCLLPLAREEGWDAALEAAVASVRDDYRCTWTSAWRRTPDRKRAVRLTVEMADDGYGRWHLEIGSLDGTVDLITPTLMGWTWIENFERMAKDMRFDADGRLVIGRGSQFLSGVTTIDVATGEVIGDEASIYAEGDTAPLNYPGEPGHASPTVETPSASKLMLMGGQGPVSDRVAAYAAEADVLFGRWQAEPWLAWWSAVGATEVYLPVWYSGDKAKTVLQFAGDRLTATRYRPPESVPADPQAAREVARTDAMAIVEKVRKRFNLPEPPPLLPSKSPREEASH